MCEIILCELCNEEITPNTIKLYMRHPFKKYNINIMDQYQCTSYQNCVLYQMGFVKNNFITPSQFLTHYINTHYTDITRIIKDKKKLIKYYKN